MGYYKLINLLTDEQTLPAAAAVGVAAAVAHIGRGGLIKTEGK